MDGRVSNVKFVDGKEALRQGPLLWRCSQWQNMGLSFLRNVLPTEHQGEFTYK